MIKMPPRPGKALEEAVSLWLEVGSLAPLEHAVYAGYGQLLEGRTSRIPKVNAFLKKVPQYQARAKPLCVDLSKYNLFNVRQSSIDLFMIFKKKKKIDGSHRRWSDKLKIYELLKL